MGALEHVDRKEGFLFAGGAYFIWGVLPLFLKLLSHIPAWEIVPHRIVWSLPIAAMVIWLRGLGPALWKAVQSPRTLFMACLTAALVTMNWGVYVWAITSGHALDTALGYYINPLFSVLLAAVLLGERLNRLQTCAVLLAFLAVALLTFEAGGLPWVSIALTVTWGFYAYFKRTLPVGPTEGFFLEVLLLSPFALAAMVWFASRGNSHFLQGNNVDTALLMASSVFTAVPLILYAMGAKLLRLTTIAILQYSAPTMVFLIAVFLFKEPFSSAKLMAFILIWLALAIYTWSLVKFTRTT